MPKGGISGGIYKNKEGNFFGSEEARDAGGIKKTASGEAVGDEEQSQMTTIFFSSNFSLTFWGKLSSVMRTSMLSGEAKV